MSDAMDYAGEKRQSLASIKLNVFGPDYDLVDLIDDAVGITDPTLENARANVQRRTAILDAIHGHYAAAISDLTARLAEAERLNLAGLAKELGWLARAEAAEAKAAHMAQERDALIHDNARLVQAASDEATRATAAEAALATVTAERDEALKTVRRLQLEGTGADWQQREGETQTALQAIGEEFGFLGGEPRVDGVRRVLTEQRAALATAVEVMKPFAEEADSILPHVENQERPRIELLLGASTAYFTVGDLRRVRDFIRDHGGVKP
jgi:hypothetical protein